MFARIIIKDSRLNGLEKRINRTSKKELTRNAYDERCISVLERLRSIAIVDTSFVDIDKEIER